MNAFGARLGYRREDYGGGLRIAADCLDIEDSIYWLASAYIFALVG